MSESGVYERVKDSKAKAVLRKAVYAVLGVVDFVFPKVKQVFIYEDNHLEDSNLAVAEYLLENTDYKVICHTRHQIGQAERLDGIKYVSGMLSLLCYCMTSKVVVETHMQQIKFHPPKRQLVLQMWHGSPIKYSVVPKRKRKCDNTAYNFSWILYPSEFFKKITMNMFGADDEVMMLNGLPRNDDLFYKGDIGFLNMDDFRKCLVWLPTYRNSKALNLGGRFKAQFPIVNEENIEELNGYLYKNEMLLIVKIHPLQDEILDFDWNHSNIVKIDNSQLSNNKLSLYKVLAHADAIITDYSSVVFDYLLLNRPIGFGISDYEEYDKLQGFSVEDVKSIMPGEMFYDYDGLIAFLDSVRSGKDRFNDERIRVNRLVNYYMDGKNCERVKILIDKYMR